MATHTLVLRPLCCHAPAHPPTQATPSPPTRILFACGGSGGHIFPALAIASALRTLSPSSTSVSFIGSPSGMESTLVPSAGFDFLPSPVGSRGPRLFRPPLNPLNLLLPIRLLISVISSLRLLRALRPSAVVGTGAHRSAPACLAAVLAGIPIVVQEQNAIPGLVNRVLAPYADRIFLAFTTCLNYFPRDKCKVVGNPLRIGFGRGHGRSKEEARVELFGEGVVGDVARVVLVLGGSTGANALNAEFVKVYEEMLEVDEGRCIVWQTGKAWYDEVRSSVRDHPRLIVTPFLNAIELAYAAADVVVSRAGAMTCTEILTMGKPSILIPSPTAADDHQTENAYIMADLAGSKVLIEEELDSSTLKTAINDILGNENLMGEMSEKALRAARPNAALDIARYILSLVERSSP